MFGIPDCPSLFGIPNSPHMLGTFGIPVDAHCFYLTCPFSHSFKQDGDKKMAARGNMHSKKIRLEQDSSSSSGDDSDEGNMNNSPSTSDDDESEKMGCHKPSSKRKASPERISRT